ncbi:MAG: trypsin-like serine protease [Planctomycetes bacterium]|nr:trypsin-like serine protease [Planctomycetota bacterium]
MLKARSLAAVGLMATLMVGGSQAMGGIIRADRSDSQYLNLAQDSKYQAVGQFTWSDTQYNYFASGTLISSPGNLWVLTAAHVLDTAASRSFILGGTSYSVAQSVVYPSWTGNLNAGYDIALAKLSIAPSGITPATLYTGSSEAGKVATFVGYGMTGTGLTGATTFDSLKRAGQNTLDVLYRTGSATRMLGTDFDNPSGTSNVYGSSTALNLEYLTSFGDSGGGAFIDVAGVTYLAGVTSWGADYNSNGLDDDYGDIGGYTRVSSFASWINSTISAGTGGGGGGGGGGKGGGKPHDLTSEIPEPSSVAVLMLGMAFVARRRQRGA